MSKTRKCQGAFASGGDAREGRCEGEAVTRFATAQIVCQFSTRIAANRLECLNLLWAAHAVYNDCMFIALYSKSLYKAACAAVRRS